MVTRRTRTISAPAEDVWRVATDPHHLPRWWPATERVESVSRAGWTSVLGTPRGRTVRADYSMVTTEPPRRAAWRQDVEGTPFERLFDSVSYELRLEPADGNGDGTKVSLQIEQEPRGWARFGRIQIRMAARRQLDEALRGLAAVLEP